MNEQIMQVVKFLFVPEAMLSVVFLVVFVLILIFGVIVYRKNHQGLMNFRENAVEEYETVSRKTPPEIFLKKRIDSFSAGEGIIEGIPDVFVSVGILATFIGLGIAIQEAASLLTADKFEIEKMIGLLGIIAFKFQTSVWGITFSLLFRRFAVENYFTFKQETVDEIRELLYAKERDSVQSLLESQNGLISTLIEEKINADKNLVLRLDELVKNITLQQDAIFAKDTEQNNLRHSELITLLKSLQETQNMNTDKVRNLLADIYARQDDIYKTEQKENALMNKGQMERFVAFQKKLFDALSKDAQTQTNAFNELAEMRSRMDNLENATNKYMETALSFEEQVVKFNEQVQSFRAEIVTMEQNISATLDEIGAKQFDTLIKMHQHIEDLQKIFLRDENQYVRQTRESFQNVLKHSEDTFKTILNDSIRNVNDSYTREVERFANVTGNLANVLDKIDAHVIKMREELTESQKAVSTMNKSTSQTLTNIIENIGESAKTYKANLLSVHNELRSTFSEIKKLETDLTNAHTKLLGDFSSVFKQNLNSLKNEQDNFRDGMLVTLDAINSDYKSMFDEIKESMSKIIESNNAKRLEQSVEEFKAEVLRISDELIMRLTPPKENSREKQKEDSVTKTVATVKPQPTKDEKSPPKISVNVGSDGK